MAELSTNTGAICMLIEKRLEERLEEIRQRCQAEVDDFGRQVNAMLDELLQGTGKTREDLEVLLGGDQSEESRSE